MAFDLFFFAVFSGDLRFGIFGDKMLGEWGEMCILIVVWGRGGFGL